MKLSRLNRLKAFEIARFAVTKSGGNRDVAYDIVRSESRKLGLDPILMGLLIELALYFVKKWMEKRDQTAADLMGDETELALPTEYTDAMDDEVIAAFPEITEPGKL